jgi:CheY-like chemotaxis protein
MNIGRVALIDGSPADARWLELAFFQAGCSVDLVVFATEVSALTTFRRSPAPELIICEWFLPPLTFAELTTEVRLIPSYGQVPIAVATDAAEECRSQALSLGACFCLIKPIQAEQLRSMFVSVT